MFIYTILILFGIYIGICYANFMLLFAKFYYDMSLSHVSDTMHMNIEADLIAFLIVWQML